MIRLRVLGGQEFEGLSARSGEALLAQPKRIAMLAYLVLAAPRGFHGRETLINVFWPEGSRKLARGALRNSLHFLRLHLGSDAIVSRADQLAVAREVLWCDAVAFDAELASKRLHEALAHYRGDLLPALRVGGAPLFEQWLEVERTDFRRKAESAAWTLSAQDEAAGRTGSAVSHARMAARLSQEPERALRALMALLDRAGDREAALREYEMFRIRLDRELGTPPSAESQDMAKAIRERRTARAGHAGHGAAVGMGERRLDRIAVLPFVSVASRLEEERLASGLTYGVTAALSRVSSMRVIGRSSVTRYHGAGEAEIGRIAEELGVDAVLDGTVRVAGNDVAVVVRLFDARTGRPTWAEVEERDMEGVLSLQGDLVLAILAAVGVEPSDAERRRIARRPTESPAAFDRYLHGRQAWNRRAKGDLEKAIEHFTEATRLDPNFALAFAGLADSYLVLYPAASIRPMEARTRARDAAQRALSIDPELGEAFATLALARTVFDGDYRQAEEDFRRAIELSPGHATAHHWYGAMLSFVMRRFGEGARQFELAAQLDPLSAIIHNDRALALRNSGLEEEAEHGFRHALVLDPHFWRAHYDLGISLVCGGRAEEGLGHLELAWRAGAYGADPAEALSPAGEWRERLRLKLRRLERRPRQQGTTAFETALLSMLLGRRDDALRSLETLTAQGGWAVVMQYYFAFKELESDRRFRELLDDAGLGFVVAADA